MDYSRQASLLVQLLREKAQVPPGLIEVIRHGTSSQYLDALARLALEPELTCFVFATHSSIFVEISNRWLQSLEHGHEVLLAAYTRVLHCAPYLHGHVSHLFESSKDDILGSLKSKNTTTLLNTPVERLQTLLLSLFRLLQIENYTYADSVSPANVALLLTHENSCIKYLAIRVLALYLHASDARLESMIKSHCGQGEITGSWEGKTIDYALLSLWECSRLRTLRDHAEFSERMLEKEHFGHSDLQRSVLPECLSPQTVLCGKILMPTSCRQVRGGSQTVPTSTTISNLENIAVGINSLAPVLVTGSEGCGKSTLIKDIASMTGHESTMISLHVNGQIDTKLLLGTYSGAQSPGGFQWQPGVLTKAVSEGRWVLIEDLDRAPQEFLSVLLSLIERRELNLPTQSSPLRCAEGFQLIATARTKASHFDDGFNPRVNIMGYENWKHIHLMTPSQHDLEEIILHSFPSVQSMLPKLMRVYAVCSYRESSLQSSFLCGPLHLLRLCRRIQRLFQASGLKSGSEPVTESFLDDCFLEAVDVFAGVLPEGPPKKRIVSLIAQEMHLPLRAAWHLLDSRRPSLNWSKTSVRIGRVTLTPFVRGDSKNAPLTGDHSRVAPTDHFLRCMESVAVSVQLGEPCLLVGETGTGKTTLIQYLANILNHKLVILNLSPQTEVGDLLGTYKPTNIMQLVNGIRDIFDDLLHLTFPTRENLQFIEAVSKAIRKRNWSRTLSLWNEALRTVKTLLESAAFEVEVSQQGPNNKRRRIQVSREDLSKRWLHFAGEVESLRMHLSHGSKGFAFSFVESNLIRAARNGDWVFLDEINLASPDILDVLADLFDSGQRERSMFLPETGDVERVPIHHNFRIFGAMNPATDVGKRELPPGIRSKFTEIFIDQNDEDISTLKSIVGLYLRDYCKKDADIANDIASLHINIKRLQADGLLVDGSNQKPYFSLRTFTRSLLFAADTSAVYGARRALYEGFKMCFLTVLGIESALLVESLIAHHVFGSDKMRIAILRQNPRYPSDGRQYIRFKEFWIPQGGHATQQQPQYVLTAFVERNLRNLVRATSTARFPILLQGPTASGKTSMVEYLARLSGNRFVRVNNHEHTDLQEYLGTYNSDNEGQLSFQDGVLVKALKEGHWIVLDELNLAPTDVLEALNRLLDDNRELLIPETQEVVKPHPNFVLFATQNPPGIYGGRKILSRAFRNRFLEIHFDNIPQEDLRVILHERCSIAPTFCSKIVDVYERLSILRQKSRLFQQKNSFSTLRDLFRWALRSADDREKLAINGFMILGERIRDPSEKAVILRTIEETTKTKIDLSQIYSHDSCVSQNPQLKDQSHGVVWTQSMRRLLILVRRALEHNEPVLLIGETGCGKTTICQVLAKMMGTSLHTVNAHQNMESGDLIGTQRPVRHRAETNFELEQLLVETLESCDAYDEKYGRDLNELAATYDRLLDSKEINLDTDIQRRIQDLRLRSKVLFEWCDGEVVAAMKKGHHFLLDEISLADDSVLERLNSLLEPGRTLYLTEKGSEDSSVTAAEGFQFLATMNPGGDYGKKELSAALRNRFTEIWVPALSDPEELAQIVHARLLSSHKHLARRMVDFASWFTENFSPPGTCPSLRDLLAWSSFINQQSKMSPSSALAHGASLVFIDNLGTSPSSVKLNTGFPVAKQRQLCTAKLEAIFEFCMPFDLTSTPVFREDESAITIDAFKLAKKSAMASSLHYSLQAPTTLKNGMKILRALTIGKPILLEGAPGVGKTSLVSALAEKARMPLARINLSDQTDLCDLFGSDTPIEGEGFGQFTWRAGEFLQAMQNGGWVILDEINLASQSVLEGLNACFDHRGQVFIPELNETFTKHPDFVVFATQNPHSLGTGRKGLPMSFINRFTVLFMQPFSREDLVAICAASFPYFDSGRSEDIVKCAGDLDASLQTNWALNSCGGPWEINLRDCLRWLQMLDHDGSQNLSSDPQYYTDLLFVQRFRRSEDQMQVRQYIDNSSMGSAVKHLKSFSWSSELVQAGSCFLQRGASNYAYSRRVATPHGSLSLTESMLISIENAFPLLLVGSNSINRMDLVKKAADLAGAELLTLCLHNETDTSDLIGGFEQVDTSRTLQTFLCRLETYVRASLTDSLCSSSPKSSTGLLSLLSEEWTCSNIDTLSSSLQELASLLPETKFPNFANESRIVACQLSGATAVRFEWIDGRLCEAIKLGKWLVLENANCCNPAVLDRISSLLEPKGFLAINEHPDIDGKVERLNPHPAFRVIMTMDPHYGEISQATRNRCIELFVPEALGQALVSPTIDTSCEAWLSHFMPLQSFEWDRISKNIWPWLMFLSLDHLCFSDIDILNQYKKQIANGMGQIPSEVCDLLIAVIEAHQQAFAAGSVALRAIEQAYLKAFQTSPKQLQKAESQRIHPLNNASLLDSVPHAESLGRRFELLQDICFMARNLYSVIGGPDSGLQLETSLATPRKGHSRQMRVDQITRSVQSLILHIRSFLEYSDVRIDAEARDHIVFVEEMIEYVRFFLLKREHESVDSTGFDCLLALGRDILRQGRMRSSPEDFHHQATLNEVLNELSLLVSTKDLRSDFAMETLWTVLQPVVPRNRVEAEMMSKVTECANRFNTIRWSSGVDPSEQVRIESSLYLMLENTHLPEMLSTEWNNISSALEKLETMSERAINQHKPYFDDEFRILRQYIACGVDWPENLKQQVSLLSGNDIILSHYAASGSTLSKLEAFNTALGGLDNQDAFAVFGRTLPSRILSKIKALPGAPMGSLSLLTHEVIQLARSTAFLCRQSTAQYLEGILKHFDTFRLEVFESLRGSFNNLDLQDLRCYLRSLPDKFRVKGPKNTSHDSDTPRDESCEFLWAAVRTAISPPEITAGFVSLPIDELVRQMATIITHYFMGLILLFVPEKFCDPAVKRVTQRDYLSSRRVVLERKYEALKIFGESTTGSCNSRRMSMIELALRSFDRSNEDSAKVYRPTKSQVKDLQEDLNNILRSVVLSPFGTQALNTRDPSDCEARASIEHFQNDIRTLTSRLSARHADFGDISKPLGLMLTGLAAGLGLQSCAIADSNIEQVSPAKSQLNLQSFQIGSMKRATGLCPITSPNSGSTLEDRINFLEHIALVRCAESDFPAEVTEAVIQCFHAIYESWKSKLREEQDRHIARGSLYRYRDHDDQEQHADELEEDVHETFTEDTKEEVAGQSPHSSNAEMSTPMLTKRICRLHSKLFGPLNDLTQEILDLLESAPQENVQLHWLKGQSGSFTDPFEDLLPALLHSLDQQARTLQGHDKKEKLYDFYHDANIDEVKFIVQLVNTVHSRFLDIQIHWPDHHTIDDILSICRQMLELRHTIPLSIALGKLEQLYASVDEWQSIASKQYSVNVQCSSLSQWIIKWRRLELSTWAQLLDLEDEKCRSEAQSWWFVAYENIIAAPLSLDSATEDFSSFAPSLLATLQDFLSLTSIGQFAHRIEILQLFVHHLALTSEAKASSFALPSALQNILDYYARYSKVVNATLLTGRKKLAAELKDVLLLASWKDTNVAALKESAKRSHYKLIRILRKYRTMLAQPVEVSFQTYGAGTTAPDAAILSSSQFARSTLNEDVLEDIPADSKGWVEGPVRFSRPNSIARKVLEICRVPAIASTIREDVENYTLDLRMQVKALQAADLQNPGEQNVETGKHNLTQKRTLLLQTLKEVRRMGFRSNVNRDILDRQDSFSKILSFVPDMKSLASFLPNSDVDLFYDLLEIMSAARAGTQNPHSDLSHTDTARSIGLIESMLATLIDQRKSIGSAARDLSMLQISTEKLKSLWRLRGNNLSRQDAASENKYEAVCRAAEWLPSIIDTARMSLDKYSKYSGTDLREVFDKLGSQKETMAACNSKLKELPIMPPGVTSSLHRGTCESVAGRLRDIEIIINHEIGEVPSLRPFLAPLQLWTEIEHEPQHDAKRSAKPTETETFRHMISKFTDRILVTSQNIAAHLESLPRNVQASGWLHQTTTALNTILNATRISDVHHDLNDFLEIVHLVHDGTESNIQEAATICSVALPIIQAFFQVTSSILNVSALLHYSLSDLALFLSKTLVHIERNGFCRPAKDNAESMNGEKLEDGSGLGDGVASQHLRDEVDNDEDLSELAQVHHKNEDADPNDADSPDVQMTDNAFEGEDEEVSEHGAASTRSSDNSEPEPEDQVGDVDELGTGALDEQFWNSTGSDNEEQLHEHAKNSQNNADSSSTNFGGNKQQKIEDHVTATEEDDPQGHSDREDGQSEGEDPVTGEQTNPLVAHNDQSEKLDLPNGIDLDEGSSTETTSLSDDQQLANMSDGHLDDSNSDIETAYETTEDYTSKSLSEQDEDQAPDKGDPSNGALSDAIDQFEGQRSGDAIADGVITGTEQEEDGAQDKDHSVFESDMQLDQEEQQGSKHASSTKTQQNANHSSGSQSPVGGQEEGGDQEQQAHQEVLDPSKNASQDPARQLGEALKQWHRRQNEIRASSAIKKNSDQRQNAESLLHGQVAHVAAEDDQSDAQAMDVASKEEAVALNQQALEREMPADTQTVPEHLYSHGDEDVKPVEKNNENEVHAGDTARKPHVSMNSNSQGGEAVKDDEGTPSEQNMDIDKLDQDLSTARLDTPELDPRRLQMRSLQEWSQYDLATHVLALHLTEDLRLILEPTHATRLKGDFRTGKRLNMKRIIPYIASQFKKDKIWMRRSIPSKRAYQIMIAVDDSKSMQESASGSLAFQSLAMIMKSLHMLEVGQVSVVNFGVDVTVAHGFDETFTPDAGAHMLNTFSFQQVKTDVHRLVAKSTELFREARQKAFNSPADLWQLEVIISDGICENHDAIQRLVRQAQSERIMMVFVILDSLHTERSIVDMNQAVFESKSDGDGKIKIKRYLDEFPFPYYLIVGDVKDLPTVLAQALKQWFAEVTDAT